MKFKYLFSVLVICLISANAMAQQVSVNYDHNKSFTGYHTYAWGSNNANQIQNSILAQVAKQDINTALQGKGLQMVQVAPANDTLSAQSLPPAALKLLPEGVA